VLCDVYYYFNIDVEWYNALLTIFLITLLTWEFNRLVQPLVVKSVPARLNKFWYLGIFFGTGLFLSLLGTFVTVTVMGMVIHGNSWVENLNPLKLNLIYAGLINLFFHLLNSIFYFFSAYRKKWAEAEELRRISNQAELQMIKSQINPHFLFNNLNVLSNMVMKDNPGANKFIEEFSKVYRYILSNHDKELVELKAELEFIKPYVFLLQQRFAQGLKIDISVPPRYNNSYIIPVALQMLIENAIKHNIVSRGKPLHIELTANGNDTLVVRNNLQPRNAGEISTQIGLKNIAKRYELICGKSVIINHSKDFFEVELPLLSLN